MPNPCSPTVRASCSPPPRRGGCSCSARSASSPTSCCRPTSTRRRSARSCRARLPRRLAYTKAQTARAHADRDPELRNAFILAADTVVAVGRRILPKPEFTDEAAACLRLLSGRGHRVYGALCLITPKGKVQEPHRRDAHPLQAAVARGDRDLPRLRRMGGQGRRLRHPGPRRRLRHQLVGSYTNVVGLRALRDDGAARRRGLPGLRPLGDPDVSEARRAAERRTPLRPRRKCPICGKPATQGARSRSARGAAPRSTSTAGFPGRT